MPSGRKPIHIGCRVYDCDRKHTAKGLCDRHYQRLRLNIHPEYRENARRNTRKWNKSHKKQAKEHSRKYYDSGAGKQAILRMHMRNPEKFYRGNKYKERKGIGQVDPSYGEVSRYWREMRKLMMQFNVKRGDENGKV